MPTIIQVQKLTKSFGPRTALSKLSFNVEAGEFVTLVGPNGAGKTTLLRILATLAHPTSGSVRIDGLNPAHAGTELRRRIGFLSHRTLLYEDLTAEQNLAFYARLYDVPDSSARITELLEQVGLSKRRHDLVRTFSRGMQQRLSVARTVLHRPRLLLLDEPYTGLDFQAMHTLDTLLAQLSGGGCTVILTTHDIERGLQIGQRVVALARGKLVYDAPLAQTDLAAFPNLYQQLTA